MDIRGAFTALVTPFTREGAIDEPRLRALVERQIQHGVDGLVPVGTTGESTALWPEEQRDLVRIVVEAAAGRVPVFAGVGASGTDQTIARAKDAKELGADGLLVVTPPYNKPTQRGLVAHFRAVAAATDLPVMLYNNPGRSAVDFSVDSLAELVEVDTIVAVKEASGNVLRAQEIVARFGERFAVLSGDDALALPVMAAGGVGVVSVTSNLFPAEVAEVTKLFLSGDQEDARAVHHRLLPVHRAMFVETSPGPVKAVMASHGLLGPILRLPLVMPSADVIARLEAVVAASGMEVVVS